MRLRKDLYPVMKGKGRGRMVRVLSWKWIRRLWIVTLYKKEYVCAEQILFSLYYLFCFSPCWQQWPHGKRNNVKPLPVVQMLWIWFLMALLRQTKMWYQMNHLESLEDSSLSEITLVNEFLCQLNVSACVDSLLHLSIQNLLRNIDELKLFPYELHWAFNITSSHGACLLRGSTTTSMVLISMAITEPVCRKSLKQGFGVAFYLFGTYKLRRNLCYGD